MILFKFIFNLLRIRDFMKKIAKIKILDNFIKSARNTLRADFGEPVENSLLITIFLRLTFCSRLEDTLDIRKD